MHFPVLCTHEWLGKPKYIAHVTHTLGYFFIVKRSMLFVTHGEIKYYAIIVGTRLAKY